MACSLVVTATTPGEASNLRHSGRRWVIRDDVGGAVPYRGRAAGLSRSASDVRSAAGSAADARIGAGSAAAARIAAGCAAAVQIAACAAQPNS